MRLYGNGVQISSGSNSGLIDIDTDTSFAPKIGAYVTGTGVVPARMDDVRVYNRALSVAEIKSLAQMKVIGDNNNIQVVSSAMDVDDDLNINVGTFDIDTNDPAVNVGGNMYITEEATFLAGAGMFTFDGASGQTIFTGTGTGIASDDQFRDFRLRLDVSKITTRPKRICVG